MRELRRVAAPGAHLLATVPAYSWLWSQHDAAHHHFRRYTLRDAARTATREGWEPSEWSYFNYGCCCRRSPSSGCSAAPSAGGRSAPGPEADPAAR